MVTVKFGANTMGLDKVGSTISELRSDLVSVLGMSGEEQARVNNAFTAESDYVVQEGDVVEFVKPSGEKG